MGSFFWTKRTNIRSPSPFCGHSFAASLQRDSESDHSLRKRRKCLVDDSFQAPARDFNHPRFTWRRMGWGENRNIEQTGRSSFHISKEYLARIPRLFGIEFDRLWFLSLSVFYHRQSPSPGRPNHSVDRSHAIHWICVDRIHRDPLLSNPLDCGSVYQKQERSESRIVRPKADLAADVQAPALGSHAYRLRRSERRPLPWRRIGRRGVLLGPLRQTKRAREITGSLSLRARPGLPASTTCVQDRTD